MINNYFLVQMIDECDPCYRSFLMVRFGPSSRAEAISLFTKEYNECRAKVIAANPEEWSTSEVLNMLRESGWNLDTIEPLNVVY